MDEREYQLEIISQMAKNEIKLSELYAKYAHAFPTRREFWNDIAREEVSHSAWIDTLKKRVEEGFIQFSSDRFNMDLLNDFYKYVQAEELKISEEMPLISALVASKEIEETLLEKKFFEVFKGDAPELEILLLALEYSTKNHREIVIKAWEEERKLIEA
ncbi:MAG TPA: hypothetical protein DEA43_04240 [Candidatus Moranbacteria bacterium]|nr:hypothetical protein [Candidatus Moranbacteria bacterium]HBT46063.1 hypothetical protein [Candidatus Moranbacteria bacterium]